MNAGRTDWTEKSFRSDKRVAAKATEQIYKWVVRSAILLGLDIAALTKRYETGLEVAGLNMLRFSLGLMRMDRIRNKHIRGTANVLQFRDYSGQMEAVWTCEEEGQRIYW